MIRACRHARARTRDSDGAGASIGAAPRSPRPLSPVCTTWLRKAATRWRLQIWRVPRSRSGTATVSAPLRTFRRPAICGPGRRLPASMRRSRPFRGTGTTRLERNVIGICEYDAAIPEATLGNAAAARTVAAKYRQAVSRTQGRARSVAASRAALLEGVMARTAGDHETAIARFKSRGRRGRTRPARTAVLSGARATGRGAACGEAPRRCRGRVRSRTSTQ